MKHCPGCDSAKPLSEFHRSRAASDGLQRTCKSCVEDYQLVWKFGMTRGQRDEILAEQGGVCAICEANEPGGQMTEWAVDHDHKCCPGRKSCGTCVRGLLCDKCNRGMGFFDDDPEWLLAAADYLRIRSSQM